MQQELLREGDEFKYIRRTAKDFVEAPTKIKLEEEIDEFKYVVAVRFADKLLNGNPSLDKTFPTRLEEIAYEMAYETGFGKPQRSEFKDIPAYEKALKESQINEAVGITAVIMGENGLGNKKIKALYKRGLAEGKLDAKSPLIEDKTKKVSYNKFHKALEKSTAKIPPDRKNLVTIIDDIVFPKVGDGVPKSTELEFRDVKARLRAARYCTPQDYPTYKLIDSIYSKMTGSKMPPEKGRATDLQADYAKFLREPISTSLTIRMFEKKVEYAVAQSGYYGPSLEDVRKAVGKDIMHIFRDTNLDTVVQVSTMMQQYCRMLMQSRFLKHKSARAFTEAIDTLFQPQDFKRYSNKLQDQTPQSLKKMFLKDFVKPAVWKASTYRELSRDLVGVDVMKTTNTTNIYLSATEPDVSIMLDADTYVAVEREDLVRQSKLVRVTIDGLQYLVPGASLSKIDAESKSKARKEAKTSGSKAKSKETKAKKPAVKKKKK